MKPPVSSKKKSPTIESSGLADYYKGGAGQSTIDSVKRGEAKTIHVGEKKSKPTYPELASKAEAATEKTRSVVSDPKSTFKDKQSAHIAASVAHRKAWGAAPVGSSEIKRHYSAMTDHTNSKVPEKASGGSGGDSSHPHDEHGRFTSK